MELALWSYRELPSLLECWAWESRFGAAGGCVFVPSYLVQTAGFARCTEDGMRRCVSVGVSKLHPKESRIRGTSAGGGLVSCLRGCEGIGRLQAACEKNDTRVGEGINADVLFTLLYLVCVASLHKGPCMSATANLLVIGSELSGLTHARARMRRQGEACAVSRRMNGVSSNLPPTVETLLLSGPEDRGVVRSRGRGVAGKPAEDAAGKWTRT